ncbi:MAG: hypothetical protein N7Q72_04375, partial [Spiroplasma sp. Tabriz.8]|nr:hypothetical protein [Spiroplasma sp. Tabriz.8]
FSFCWQWKQLINLWIKIWNFCLDLIIIIVIIIIIIIIIIYNGGYLIYYEYLTIIELQFI